jgi:hypothetical protein
MASPCTSVSKGGDTEGGRMVQLLMNAKRCDTLQAIQRARASCCQPTPVSRAVVPLESANLQAKVAACARLNAQQATILASQPLKGVSEGARIAILMNQTCANTGRFDEYLGPRVPFVCPPMPTEITNANLPKPSTRCDTLNLLATGKPPNSIFTQST